MTISIRSIVQSRCLSATSSTVIWGLFASNPKSDSYYGGSNNVKNFALVNAETELISNVMTMSAGVKDDEQRSHVLNTARPGIDGKISGYLGRSGNLLFVA